MLRSCQRHSTQLAGQGVSADHSVRSLQRSRLFRDSSGQNFCIFKLLFKNNETHFESKTFHGTIILIVMSDFY
jgi:hypothetical protein